MKKAVYFLSVFVFMVGFLSCTKEDEDYSLSGTTWEDVDDSVLKIIKFDNATCTYTISSTALSVKTTFSYDYSIAYPTISMESQTSGYADLKGNISGGTMTVVNTSQNSTIGTFIKQ